MAHTAIRAKECHSVRGVSLLSAFEAAVHAPQSPRARDRAAARARGTAVGCSITKHGGTPSLATAALTIEVDPRQGAEPASTHTFSEETLLVEDRDAVDAEKDREEQLAQRERHLELPATAARGRVPRVVGPREAFWLKHATVPEIYLCGRITTHMIKASGQLCEGSHCEKEQKARQ